MQTASYRLERPQECTTSIIFASPHSGRDYPWAFLRDSILDSHAIRSSEDAFVDDLYSSAPGYGAPLLVATVPRAYVDLNRAPDELDSAVIEGVRKAVSNPRIASGLGVIPRVVSSGRAIYRGKLKLAEAEARIAKSWYPYHQALQGLIAENVTRFGESILIDCHSMPHEAVDRVCPHGQARPDVVIGDRFGASARSDMVDRIEHVFRAAGLNVVRNTPFAGAYVAQHYGRPSVGQHAVQVEINRSIYMDETTISPNENFSAFQMLMSGIVQGLVEIGRRELPMAAE